MRLAIALSAAVSLFSVVGPADAAGPFRAKVSTTPNKQAVIGAYGKAVYPRYYWGFHAREFQNIGVPHGDVGMLGSGIQRNPW